MGASRGEAGILGEGIRQALLRDKAYGPALSAAAGDARMTDRLVVEDPAAVAAERLVRPPSAGATWRSPAARPRKAAYEAAAGSDADWSRVTFWFGDERCVGPDHEHSNYAMARAALLDRIAGPGPVRRIEGERGPEAAAAAYEAALREDFGDERARAGPGPARARPRRPHRLAVPGRRRAGRARAARGRGRDAGHGAAGVPGNPYAPGREQRARGDVPGLRRGQGRGGGARVLRHARPGGAGQPGPARATASSRSPSIPRRPSRLEGGA